jgi:hypothetical protein
MKNLVGMGIKVAVDGVGQVAGTLISETHDLIFVKGGDGKIVRIPKGHIAMFVPDREPKGSVGLHVLYCENRKTTCQGVQYIVVGEGFKNSDFDKFMAACPCRASDCSHGTKGEIRCVDPAFLASMLGGTMYGDFPKK